MALRRSVVAVVVICVAAVGALTGCQRAAEPGRAVHAASKPSKGTGGTSADSLDGLTAPQISRRMSDAMNLVTSMTMEFSGVLQGRQSQLKIAATTGGACAAAARLNGGTMQLIRTADRTAYIKGDAAYWMSQSAKGRSIGTLAANRWIRFPATSLPGRRLAQSCDVKTIVRTLGTEHDSATRGGPGMVDGHPVVTIRKKERQGISTYSVAAHGPARLLRITSNEGALTMTFGSFDQPVHAVAPPANQTIDLSLFGGDSEMGLNA